jgi:tyrosyl-tRNA synthetase
MTAPRSDFLRTLVERGFVHQLSDAAGIDEAALEGRLTTYVGYDCTAPSLHVGHLLSIMMLHWLQATGAGRPIVLMGGGTTRVGDPSGRDETRKILTLEQIDANKASIREVFTRFIRFGEGGHEAAMADNAEWLTQLNYLEFLRDVGRHFSVNRMLSMDSVRMRLDRDQELSFIEFNYMVLQSYDFVELHRRYGCVAQMGGSDQWGNIVSGIDLGRRLGTGQLFALTAPLLTTASGAKMGKTAAGAVWLNADLLAPYGYWQFWRNAEDADVGRFLRLLRSFRSTRSAGSRRSPARTSTRPRRCSPPKRRRSCTAARRPRGRLRPPPRLSRRVSHRRTCRASSAPGPSWRRVSASGPRWCWPVSPRRTARPPGPSRTMRYR